MSLRDNIAHDIGQVFLNPSEFAQEHVINGRRVMCVHDSDILASRGKYQQGASWSDNTDTLVLHVAQNAFSEMPHVDMDILLDGQSWRVASCETEDGMYILTLHEQQARIL